MTEDLRGRRISYDLGALDVATVARDPFEQFRTWFELALATPELLEPHGVTVATADAHGRPSARIVLLRQWDARGFVFYTNYESRKGAEIGANPFAALLFWWGVLQRQVRIEGAIERVLARRERRVLRDAAARAPAQRVGVASERRRARSRDARARDGRRRRAFRRRGRTAAALGRLPRRPRPFRVLARASESRSRPHRLRTYAGRLVARSTLALTGGVRAGGRAPKRR